jgi:pimeloyl-ACP methyl ester carboxylesterase
VTRRIDAAFDAAGVPMRYVEQGQGDAVVLVHCYTGNLDDQWIATGVLDGLAAAHRTIAFDLRGHGRSGKPHDPAAYGVEMAEDVVRLLDHLRVPRAHVVGYSMGAHLVALLLARHADRLVTAALGGATGRRRWTAADDARVEQEAAEMDQGSLRAQIVRLWPAGRPLPGDAEIARRSAHQLAGQDPRALAAIRRSNRAQVVDDADLARSAVPTLGIVGTRDPYLDDFRTLARVMPTLTVETIDGATHGNAVARAEFLAILRAFLRRHDTTTGPAAAAGR